MQRGFIWTFLFSLALPARSILADPCDVKRIQDVGGGFAFSWSPTEDLILLSKLDENRKSQLYLMKPDGSDLRCVTCQNPAPVNAPAYKRHKAVASWHPSGEWIAVQAERPRVPAVDDWGIVIELGLLKLVQNGANTNIYVLNKSATEWHQLTHYSTGGVLGPQFSPDGSRLMWSELVAASTAERPWGTWKLMLADYRVQGGVPRLENARELVSEAEKHGGVWFESHGFTPDGRKVVFTSDIGLSMAGGGAGGYGMDIWTKDLVTGELKNYTDLPMEWDEHGVFSYGGNKIAYMSSQWYPEVDIKNIADLKTELTLMDADGSNKRAITHYNTPGYPESTSVRTVVGSSSWRPDGTQLMFGRLPDGFDYFTDDPTLALLTFEGACGNPGPAFGESENGPAFYAFPNPATGDEVTIRFESPTAESVTVNFFDRLGRRVHEAIMRPSTGPGYEYRWDVSGLAPGLYWYAVEAKGSGGEAHKRKRLAIVR